MRSTGAIPASGVGQHTQHEGMVCPPTECASSTLASLSFSQLQRNKRIQFLSPASHQHQHLLPTTAVCREPQAAVISNALSGNDSLVVMATGGGKSICYQLPPLVSGMPHISRYRLAICSSCRQHLDAAVGACQPTVSWQLRKSIVPRHTTTLLTRPRSASSLLQAGPVWLCPPSLP